MPSYIGRHFALLWKHFAGHPSGCGPLTRLPTIHMQLLQVSKYKVTYWNDVYIYLWVCLAVTLWMTAAAGSLSYLFCSFGVSLVWEEIFLVVTRFSLIYSDNSFFHFWDLYLNAVPQRFVYVVHVCCLTYCDTYSVCICLLNVQSWIQNLQDVVVLVLLRPIRHTALLNPYRSILNNMDSLSQALLHTFVHWRQNNRPQCQRLHLRHQRKIKYFPIVHSLYEYCQIHSEFTKYDWCNHPAVWDSVCVKPLCQHTQPPTVVVCVAFVCGCVCLCTNICGICVFVWIFCMWV